MEAMVSPLEKRAFPKLVEGVLALACRLGRRRRTRVDRIELQVCLSLPVRGNRQVAPFDGLSNRNCLVNEVTCSGTGRSGSTISLPIAELRP
jgi:hypothetical protein